MTAEDQPGSAWQLLKNRMRIVGGFLLVAGALALAALVLPMAFDDVIETRGTVVKEGGGYCTVEYRDLAGERHTLEEGGGKYGCHWGVGSTHRVWFQAESPEDANTAGPAEMAMFALLTAGFGLGAGVMNYLRLRDGGWHRRTPEGYEEPDPLKDARAREVAIVADAVAGHLTAWERGNVCGLLADGDEVAALDFVVVALAERKAQLTVEQASSLVGFGTVPGLSKRGQRTLDLLAART